jgi:hypothetical protein
VSRRRLTGVLVVAASFLLFATAVISYARRALFDADAFADRATATLRDERVRAVVADEITDGLVLRESPDLVAARPLIAAAVSGAVGGDAFTRLFRLGVRDAHRAVFSHDQGTATLTLVDVGTVVAAALQQLRPQVADEIERAGRVQLLKRHVGAVTGDLARTADHARRLSLILALLTLAATIGAVAASGDRRRTVAQLGAGVIAAGLAIVIAYLAGREIVARDAATRAVWEALLGGLLGVGLLLAAVGAIVAAAASSAIGPGALDGLAGRLAAAIANEPLTPGRRVLRASALLAAGALLVASPLLALRIAAVGLGVVLIYLGVDALLRLVHSPEAAARSREARSERRGRGRRFAAWGAGAALVAVACGVFLAGGGLEEPAAADTGRCNGYAALCDRRLDDVVLPATHNSMSAPLKGWFSTVQERSIAGQLEDGIRGLLLDTHYADRLANGRIRTQLGGEDDRRRVLEDGVDQASVDAALRLRDRLGFQGEGERGMYLCHSFCELGATPLADVLHDIHDFLVTHPGEILVIVNQDYVTAQDFVAAVRQAGLERFAATIAPGRMPTLREMVDSDRRLVLLAEEEAGGAPWYQLAYDRLVEETPYHFATVPELIGEPGLEASCRANRGPAGAPLFLLNHWVTTDPIPLPSDATRVNAYGPLLRRSRACGTARRHAMNLLAVNFYKQGDVFRVAAELNGVGPPR